jgi:phosphoglycerate dehydrogenase-like enzyme
MRNTDKERARLAEIKVVLHYDAGPWLVGRLQALAAQGLRVDACSERDDTRFVQLMADSEVLWHVLKPVTAEVMAHAPRLRLIQKIGIGVNTIDLDAARGRGIAVCNMPGTNSQAVAEMALLLMLASLRQIVHFDRRTRAGQGWVIEPELMERLGEIRGRRVGLVGFGAIPTLLAPWLKAMGADVVYTEVAEKPGVEFRFLPLDELLATSNIVSLHVPLTAETTRLIGRAALARMKPGAILVNTARGGLVDEPALIEALKSGHIAAAGLDVLTEEPAQTGNPLFALDNVVVAPHISWITGATLERSLTVAVENCRRLATGVPLQYRVI